MWHTELFGVIQLQKRNSLEEVHADPMRSRTRTSQYIIPYGKDFFLKEKRGISGARET